MSDKNQWNNYKQSLADNIKKNKERSYISESKGFYRTSNYFDTRSTPILKKGTFTPIPSEFYLQKDSKERYEK
jgi:hypothetical protein